MAKPRKATTITRKPSKPEKEKKPKSESKGYKISYKPRSTAQTHTIKQINEHEITFIIGATGTAKTFLATVAGLRLLYDRTSKINKLIIIRPAVTAQEDIGFLPGNSDEKLAHYVTPVYEHIIKLVGDAEFKHLQEKKKIEIIPIGFLRGRNFENSYVIFDEAQNANVDQFKLCITRISDNSKIAICGDVDQCDIPESTSGLVDAIPRFADDPNFGYVVLPESEIQRHPIVEQILAKYHNPDSGTHEPLALAPDSEPLVESEPLAFEPWPVII